MKTYHMGGRIGDIIFALYTIKMLGGGRLVLSDYHKPSWDLGVARSLDSFLHYQPYVEDILYFPWGRFEEHTIDYDLQQAEHDYNPAAFPEWDRKPWPSNANILKRYAVHFGVEYPPKEPWLEAPKTKQVDVAMHAPLRRAVRENSAWNDIISVLLEEKLKLANLGAIISPNWEWVFPEINIPIGNFLETSDYINSAKVFLGTVSSCNAVAEGLGKITVVEQAPDCFNVNPTHSINGMSNEEVAELVRRICEDRP